MHANKVGLSIFLFKDSKGNLHAQVCNEGCDNITICDLVDKEGTEIYAERRGYDSQSTLWNTGVQLKELRKEFDFEELWNDSTAIELPTNYTNEEKSIWKSGDSCVCIIDDTIQWCEVREGENYKDEVKVAYNWDKQENAYMNTKKIPRYRVFKNREELIEKG